MCAQEMIAYGTLSVLMITVGSSLRAIINAPGNATQLPQEWCRALPKLSTMAGSLSVSSTTITELATNTLSWIHPFWIIVCVLLPILAFLINGWLILTQQNAWPPLLTRSFWFDFGRQHKVFLFTHGLGQSISFSASEVFKFIFLKPNRAFWKNCFDNKNNITLSNTSTLLSNINDISDSWDSFRSACKQNQSLTLQRVCAATQINNDDIDTSLFPDALWTTLIQNLHAAPNIILAMFGTATVSLVLLIYRHPQRGNVSKLVLLFIYFIFVLLFMLLCFTYYFSGQNTFSELMYSFVLGLLLQLSLLFVLHKKSPVTNDDQTLEPIYKPIILATASVDAATAAFASSPNSAQKHKRPTSLELIPLT